MALHSKPPDDFSTLALRASTAAGGRTMFVRSRTLHEGQSGIKHRDHLQCGERGTACYECTPDSEKTAMHVDLA